MVVSLEMNVYADSLQRTFIVGVMKKKENDETKAGACSEKNLSQTYSKIRLGKRQ